MGAQKACETRSERQRNSESRARAKHVRCEREREKSAKNQSENRTSGEQREVAHRVNARSATKEDKQHEYRRSQKASGVCAAAAQCVHRVPRVRALVDPMGRSVWHAVSRWVWAHDTGL